ncbi:hypothetical protein GC207_11140 [bacterium]|nr:hypothetical protein [bacterium]
MHVHPVTEREMHAESRHAMTWWARVAVFSLSVFAFLWCAIMTPFDRTTGSRLFYLVNTLLFIVIWILVPLLVADSLSQERRENTLGLLILAGLKSREIVVGKSIAQALRGMNLLLVNAPIMVIPIILGGLTWTEVVIALMMNSAAVFVALSAGLLASALSRRWWRALPLAWLLSALLMTMFTLAIFIGEHMALFSSNPSNATARIPAVRLEMDFALLDWVRSPWQDRLDLQLNSATGAPPAAYGVDEGWWVHEMTLSAPNLPTALLLRALLTLLLALVFHRFAVWLAALLIDFDWRARPHSAAFVRWKQFWLSPRFLHALLRRRLSLAMNRNPIGWFHQRSWKSRLLKWGWFLALAVAASLVLSDSVNYAWGLPNALRWLGMVLLANIAYTAGSCFRHDLESGTMELLLVSSLSDRLILKGRIAGVAGQYLPSLVLLLVIWFTIFFDLPGQYFTIRGQLHWFEPVIFTTAAIALLYRGARESLRRRAPGWTWLLTLFHGIILPGLVAVLVTAISAFFVLLIGAGSGESSTVLLTANLWLWLAMFIIVQVIGTAISWFRALDQLRARNFSASFR